MPSATTILVSQMGWPGNPTLQPYLPGTMEPEEMAAVQGFYAGITFGTGSAAATGSSYAMFRPLWRGGVRRR